MHACRSTLEDPTGQAAISLLDAFVSDAQDTVDQYQRWLLRRHRRALVIQNGIPVPTTSRARPEMLAHFGLPDHPETRVIGQIARLMPFKGQEILIRAAAPILRERPHLCLLICGFAADPAYRQRLLEQAQAEGVAERVRVEGYQGPIGDVWSIVDIHAHPTVQDSSPIAIHESMALGLPAVVSDQGGIPELVLDGVSGLVVRKGDVAACEAALRRLLDDDALCRRLGAGARQRYLARHTPEVMTRATEALFEDLLRRRLRR